MIRYPSEARMRSPRDLEAVVDSDTGFSVDALCEAGLRSRKYRFPAPLSYPCVSRDWETQVRYWLMRLNGQSHNMAEVLATRSFPGVKTDAVFNEGKFSSDAGQVGAEQQWLRQQAEAAGVSTNGKWYCRGLASFPGDPTAWVDSRGDVLRIAKEKNMKVHGYVEHQGYEADPGTDVTLADDILEDEVADILDSNPEADPEHVREEVYALRTGAVDPNPLCVQE